MMIASEAVELSRKAAGKNVVANALSRCMELILEAAICGRTTLMVDVDWFFVDYKKSIEVFERKLSDLGYGFQASITHKPGRKNILAYQLFWDGAEIENLTYDMAPKEYFTQHGRQ